MRTYLPKGSGPEDPGSTGVTGDPWWVISWPEAPARFASASGDGEEAAWLQSTTRPTMDLSKATDMQTIGGHITWTSGDPKLNPVPNVCTTPVVGGRWVKGTKYPYDIQVVSNSPYPDIPTQSELLPIKY
jgi:hypothetical protein